MSLAKIRVLAFFVVVVALGVPGSALAQSGWGEPINTPDRFIVLASYNNQAVYDKETGLVWEQSPSTTTAKDWFGASFSCSDSAAGNRKGWRLATIQELASLIDPTVPFPGPTLPAGHPFSSNVQPTFYWSATTFAQFPTSARGVNLSNGKVGSNDKSSSFSNSVWCVRGGQGPDAQ
jgi:hypothetical protein